MVYVYYVYVYSGWETSTMLRKTGAHNCCQPPDQCLIDWHLKHCESLWIVPGTLDPTLPDRGFPALEPAL